MIAPLRPTTLLPTARTPSPLQNPTALLPPTPPMPFAQILPSPQKRVVLLDYLCLDTSAQLLGDTLKFIGKKLIL